MTGSPGVTDNSVAADQGDNSYVFGAPVIDSVAPQAGPLTGGNDVVITGSGFENPDLTFEGVVFDPTSDTSGDYSEGIDAPDATVVSDTEIDVTAPDATDAAFLATSLETEVAAKFEVTDSPGEADDSVPADQGDNSYVFGTTVGATISQVGISGSKHGSDGHRNRHRLRNRAGDRCPVRHWG